MVDKTRKQVPYEVGGCYFERDKVVDLIEELKEKVRVYGDGIYIDTVPGRYGDSDYLAYFIMRDETDDQMATRIRREEQQEENSRQWELQQLAALQKKYGNQQA
jgi:hypothetical protein